MLLQINIKNFALIENLSINFDDGFNVLTGETGAGKSILIDAINFVLGGKFNKDIIRTGENSTFVEAIFTIDFTNENIIDALKELDIEYDDLIIISRESYNSGRSIIKINGKTVILSALKRISELLIDIHGQHENVRLLNSATHITYLDNFCLDELKEPLKEYTSNYDKLQYIIHKIQELEYGEEDKEKIVSYIKFQIDEIEKSKLYVGEDEELNEKINILTNSEKISRVLNKSYEALYNGNEESPSLYDSLDYLIKELRSIENTVKKVKDISDSLEEAYYNIEQNISEIRSIKDNYNYDANELEEANSRIYEISRLKKKYGDSVEDILAYKNKLLEDYENIINKAEIIDKLNKEKKAIAEKCMEIAGRMHDIRIKNAMILEKSIKEELSYIGMGKSTFKVSIIKEESLRSNGLSKVQFLISTNPGEPLKALDKIASGGELSRIMLSLKSVFVDKDNIPTVIFDEIDTGISGAVAQRVAEKMYKISQKHQVFCVTHLPQIASMSDIHYSVSKKVDKDKTYTIVKKLSLDEKVTEVSKMIGGVEVTQITLNNASQLIDMAKNIKNTLKHSK
ncbi:DNA repair protein RecN [Clostridium sp. 19966]|uniref:DNA repair protein RecN n=1 Tax=Clostridium sp. 19966 TaxID=2768166 RepID=UPI0028DF37D5|nr:DNA repair protein RecN [Clostridium sp. 19966]MDT8716571.1 DNA repair protein RecN [Clostridium sp. 19966]